MAEIGKQEWLAMKGDTVANVSSNYGWDDRLKIEFESGAVLNISGYIGYEPVKKPFVKLRMTADPIGGKLCASGEDDAPYCERRAYIVAIGRRRPKPVPVVIPFYYVDGTPFAYYKAGGFYDTLFANKLKSFEGIVLVECGLIVPHIMHTWLEDGVRRWETIHIGNKVDRAKVEAFFRDRKSHEIA